MVPDTRYNVSMYVRVNACVLYTAVSCLYCMVCWRKEGTHQYSLSTERCRHRAGCKKVVRTIIIQDKLTHIEKTQHDNWKPQQQQQRIQRGHGWCSLSVDTCGYADF